MIKYKKSILLIIVIIISGYFFVSSIIGNDKFNNLKSFLNDEQKKLIVQHIFPKRHVYILKKEKFELNFKEEGRDIKTVESYIKLSNNKKLKK